LYEDPYLDESRFAQNHDLTNMAYFIDNFNLVFEDDFDSTEINEELWNTHLVWEDTRIINGEQQYFVTERCAFLSGAIASHDKFEFLYGYVEGRMRTSDISGALSSFYLYNRYPGTGIVRHTPEIDIVEYLGENPFGDEDAFQTYHYTDVNTGEVRSAPTMFYENPEGVLYSDEFHTYGVLWEPQLVIWYIDGEEVKRITGPQVSRQPMNIVTYLVAGSGWAPTPDADGPFPIKYEIDYIRAYQRDVYDRVNNPE